MNTFPLLPVRSPKNFLTCLIGPKALVLTTNAPAHHRPVTAATLNHGGIESDLSQETMAVID